MTEKLKHEKQFWSNKWKNSLEERGYFNEDTKSLLEKNSILFNEKTGYFNEAYAQKYRICKEFDISLDFFDGKKVIEIGPGAVMFLEIYNNEDVIGLDPLSSFFKKNKMINILNKNTIYLNEESEKIPIKNSHFDIVISRNCLDHTNDPKRSLSEMSRVLKDGGILLLSTDVEHSPTKTEPITLKTNEVINWLEDNNIGIMSKKLDSKTFNFKKGRRLIIKGVKNGKN